MENKEKDIEYLKENGRWLMSWLTLGRPILMHNIDKAKSLDRYGLVKYWFDWESLQNIYIYDFDRHQDITADVFKKVDAELHWNGDVS